MCRSVGAGRDILPAAFPFSLVPIRIGDLCSALRRRQLQLLLESRCDIAVDDIESNKAELLQCRNGLRRLWLGQRDIGANLLNADVLATRA